MNDKSCAMQLKNSYLPLVEMSLNTSAPLRDKFSEVEKLVPSQLWSRVLAAMSPEEKANYSCGEGIGAVSEIFDQLLTINDFYQLTNTWISQGAPITRSRYRDALVSLFGVVYTCIILMADTPSRINSRCDSLTGANQTACIDDNFTPLLVNEIIYGVILLAVSLCIPSNIKKCRNAPKTVWDSLLGEHSEGKEALLRCLVIDDSALEKLTIAQVRDQLKEKMDVQLAKLNDLYPEPVASNRYIERMRFHQPELQEHKLEVLPDNESLSLN